ncbi:4'-phosphopantetheinyl transferase family protein [Dyella tabacisoli]|nr:4'-phosphopantetheinyl transferase superfamily protein [Dyella tabacisoli]
MHDAAGLPASPQAWSPPLSSEALRQHLSLPATVGLSSLPLSVLDQPLPVYPQLPSTLSRAVNKRRREYQTGRLCACAALRNAGYPHDAYPDMGEDRLPLWPNGWLGSISHSGDYAMAAAAPQSTCIALGIDIQQRVALKALMGTQSLVAQPGELAQLESFDAVTRLLLVFSAKESLYKALYPQVRRILDFDAAELIQADAQVLEFRLTCDWSSCWDTGKRISVRYVVFDEYIVTATYLSDRHST